MIELEGISAITSFDPAPREATPFATPLADVSSFSSRSLVRLSILLWSIAAVALMSALIIVPSAILALVTALSANSAVAITPAAICASLAVPLRSPPKVGSPAVPAETSM